MISLSACSSSDKAIENEGADVISGSVSSENNSTVVASHQTTPEKKLIRHQSLKLHL